MNNVVGFFFFFLVAIAQSINMMIIMKNRISSAQDFFIFLLDCDYFDAVLVSAAQ